jgi:hypothetical protein
MSRSLYITGTALVKLGSPVAIAGALAGFITGVWWACWVGLGMVVVGMAAGGVALRLMEREVINHILKERDQRPAD